MAVPQISSSPKGSCSHESNTPWAMTITPKEVSPSALGVWGLSLEAPKVTTLKGPFGHFPCTSLGFRSTTVIKGPKVSGLQYGVSQGAFGRRAWSMRQTSSNLTNSGTACRKSPLLVLAHISDQRPAPKGQSPVLTREGVHTHGDSGPRWTQSAIRICAQWHWCGPLV